jgi:hypothetical protein
MKRPPLMFAAIVIVVFLILLAIFAFWLGVFPGPYATGVTPQTP